MSTSFPMTLVVATTPSLGIGFRGSLPWPSIRSEMAYFAQVTRRAPQGSINAVIMGRKTWDSIPSKFRPLKGRINVVVSHRTEIPGIAQRIPDMMEGGGHPGNDLSIKADGVQDALSKLQAWHEASKERDVKLHRVFVIGGAEIYKSALDLWGTTRVLRTRVSNDFECDTFFPVDLQGDERWSKANKAELLTWMGEGIVSEGQDEGTEWEVEMWERASSGQPVK